ncbi:MAG: hypothetical protein K2X03_22635 [Bryobacteraceae bacterium]|nr:hypothetical protein [Bryobacteraceae bacterium]
MERRLFLPAMLLAAAPRLAAQNSWSRVRYVGGTVPAKVNPYDWNTRLTITADAIELLFAGRDRLRIAPASVTVMTYGQKAQRRVADMLALSVIATPLALFGILHKSRDHSLSLEFQQDGKPAAMLFELDKSSYRAIILALTTVTGKKVDHAP